MTTDMSKTLTPEPGLRRRCKHTRKPASLRLVPYVMDATSPTPAPPSRSCHLNRHQRWQVQKRPLQRFMGRSWKRWTIATTTRQRGRTSRGEQASRRMRYSSYHHWPHLPLVRKEGVLTLCSGLCVVRVASPRAPGPAMLLHDRFDVYNGQPISPHSHLALFVCSGIHFIFFGVITSTPCARTLSLSNYYTCPLDLNALVPPFFLSSVPFMRSFFFFLHSSSSDTIRQAIRHYILGIPCRSRWKQTRMQCLKSAYEGWRSGFRFRLRLLPLALSHSFRRSGNRFVYDLGRTFERR